VSELINLPFNECTKNHETCPVFAKATELRQFESIVVDINTNTEQRETVLGKLIIACTNGMCPGQNLDRARMIIGRNRQRDF